MKKKVLISAVAAVILAFGALQAHAQVFHDETFNNADWAITTLTMINGVAFSCTAPSCGTGNGGITGATQVLSGGAPIGNPAYRDVTITVEADSTFNPAVDTYVLGFHQFLSGHYDPSTQGPIGSIDYSEDAITLPSGEQATGPALRQNGIVYVNNSLLLSATYTATWTPLAITGLTAADFGAVGQCGSSCANANFIDVTMHPDFSGTGGPIDVGFFRGNSTRGGGYSTNDGIDNWKLSIFGPMPTPTGPTPTPTGPTAAPTPGCGNGIIEFPETCDPPGSVVGPCGQLCGSDCTFCGDGVVQSADGETCDDGNCAQCDPIHPQKALDSCNNLCQGLICEDPAKIKLTTALDVFQFHGRMVPIDGGTIDFGGSDVAIILSTTRDLVFTTSVPAGAIETRTNGSFTYRNVAAKQDGGIYKLKARLTRGTYKVTAMAYGDLSRATADMVTYVTIGGQGWTVHGLWSQTESGWAFNGSNLLP